MTEEAYAKMFAQLEERRDDAYLDWQKENTGFKREAVLDELWERFEACWNAVKKATRF